MSTVLHYLNQQEIATAVYDYIKKTRPEALPPGSGFRVSLYVQNGEFTARLEATSPVSLSQPILSSNLHRA